jgi:hypothetical protein
MKNKPYPALLRPSNLYNEIKKRVPKSRETIPLTSLALAQLWVWAAWPGLDRSPGSKVSGSVVFPEVAFCAGGKWTKSAIHRNIQRIQDSKAKLGKG